MGDADGYRDPRLAPAVRADLLLAEMTLPEKCGQLFSVSPWTLVRADGSEPPDLEAVLEGMPPGHVSAFYVEDPALHAELARRIQHAMVERSRLGIPALIHNEVVSGFMSGGHVIFPTPIGLAAGWSPELVHEMAGLIRHQMVRVGARHALGPVMDVALDARWGRLHETYGEDPYLGAAFSVAFVQGLQGEDLTHGVLATAKHFLGFGAPESGISGSATQSGSRRLRDLFAYPFEAAIQLAGLRSVMNSYGSVDSIPVAASREVLTTLLRDMLGFTGFVTADYGTIEQLVTRQRVAHDAGEAAFLALEAGLDVENPVPWAYGDVLVAEVKARRIDVALVDTAVRRVLTAKFELGLFEDPFPAASLDPVAVAAEGQDLSRELARRSVVLLKNEGLLPIDPHTRTIALIGPHADAMMRQFATYTYPAWRQAVEAILARGSASTMVGIEAGTAEWGRSMFGSTDTPTFVRDQCGGRSIAEELEARAPSLVVEAGCGLTDDALPEALARAVAAARDAEIAVLALGGASLWFHGERTEGEGSDNADISLPAAQVRLAEAIAATGTPMVVVLVQGRPFALPPAVTAAAAVMVAPYGGPFGPSAITDILFGDVDPSGRLPYSYPRSSGHLPVYHHQHAGTGHRTEVPPGATHHYLDGEATPLYPFGHGLSYTTFELAGLSHDEAVDTAGAARISAEVANTGARPGACVVQLYVRANTPQVGRPAQQLIGFAREELDAGERCRLTFTVDAALLGYTTARGDFAVDPCRVDFYLGFHSDDRRLEGAFDIVGARRPLASGERAFLSGAEVVPA
jgi:beta-glucosidase